LTKIGAGTFTLSGNTSYTGDTTISAGTLALGNGGSSGAIAGNVVNNGTLAINRSDTLTLGGVISGTGSVRQGGTGKTILAGNNSYTGGTAIRAGTLAVSADANLGAAAGGLALAGGTLQYLAGFATSRTVALGLSGGTIDTNGNNATLAGIVFGA